jgi:hypothetical protein
LLIPLCACAGRVDGKERGWLLGAPDIRHQPSVPAVFAHARHRGRRLECGWWYRFPSLSVYWGAKKTHLTRPFFSQAQDTRWKSWWCSHSHSHRPTPSGSMSSPGGTKSSSPRRSPSSREQKVTLLCPSFTIDENSSSLSLSERQIHAAQGRGLRHRCLYARARWCGSLFLGCLRRPFLLLALPAVDGTRAHAAGAPRGAPSDRTRAVNFPHNFSLYNQSKRGLYYSQLHQKKRKPCNTFLKATKARCGAWWC